MFGWDTAPSCVQHGAAAGDVYTPYKDCADFFTMGPGSTYGTATSGISGTYWGLTILGILVMVAAFVAWVMTEDRKLKQQAARLLISGHAGQVTIVQEVGPTKDRDVPSPGLGGPADLGDV
jgi:hypothetical protein